jgi:hypothetical protein
MVHRDSFKVHLNLLILHYKYLILLLLCISAVSCKKERPVFREKNINATIASADGTITINTEPGSSYISCGDPYISPQGPTIIQGLDKNWNNAVFLTIGDTCITRPGTYNFVCQYIKNYNADRITYQNDSVSNPGSITFEIVRQDILNGGPSAYVEGHFHATCKFNDDSVVVNGTFDGYLN